MWLISVYSTRGVTIIHVDTFHVSKGEFWLYNVYGYTFTGYVL